MSAAAPPRASSGAAMEALRAAIRAVEILSPTAIRVAGERVEHTPTPTDPVDPGAVMVPLLAQALYARCYVRRPGAPAPPPAAPGPGDDLSPLLSAANPSRERWEDGWHVRQALSNGCVVAERHGSARFLWPGEFLSPQSPGAPPRAGSRVTRWRPRESATMQPGFFYVFGEEGWDDDVPLVRVYWNVSPEGAPALTGSVAAMLNRWGVPFRYKCLAMRSLYPRTDAAVLYLGRRSWTLASELLGPVHRANAGALGADTPLFARRLGRGVSLADDPGTGESFGMHRCRLLAEGLWSAWRAGRRGTAERIAAVRDAFGREGISIEQPWLSPGRTTDYPGLADD